MKKVAVFTGTRAEYGLLYWLLKDIQADDEMILQLVVSGSHLVTEFGATVIDIERDGLKIAAKVDMLMASDSSTAVAKSLGIGIIGYADAFERLQPDLLVVLGDRYETFAAVQTAYLMRIPIVHIHGGEITQGANDDAIRHAITKLSYLHMTSHARHRQRVIQLGEQPQRVFDVGAIGLDHIHRTQLLTREELIQSLDFDLSDPFVVATYHPVTLANEPAEQSFNNLLAAFDEFPQLKVILTYPNADAGGRKIIPLLEHYAQSRSDQVLVSKSLGQRRYLSALKYASAVIGNSSSGIIEAPSFRVPTVNIGERQKRRLCAPSVFHCTVETRDIVNTMIQASKFAKATADYVNPYGDGHTSQKILDIIKHTQIDPIKVFYDIEGEK